MRLLRIFEVPSGTFLVAVTFLFLVNFSVNSIKVVENMVATSGNETVVVDNLNATGEFMKRVGQFSSRALWMRKGKFVLPAGTLLSIAPKITIPAFRRKAFKGGLSSDFQASWYFYLNCDKLGFTHDMHPFPFDRPPFYPFGSLMRPIESKDYPGQDEKKKEPTKMSMMSMRPHKPHHMGFHGKGARPPPPSYDGPHSQSFGPDFHSDPFVGPGPGQGGKGVVGGNGGIVDLIDEDSIRANSDAVYTFFPITKKTGEEAKSSGMKRNRKPRAIMELPPPDMHPGGERTVLLPSVENLMSNLGFEGRGCMLRAICEIHEFPMQAGYGLIGEMIALFFSVSQSPYAESHMPEYLKAENAGRSGSCAEYRNLCAKSIFKWEMKKKQDVEVETNEVPMPMSPFRSKFEDDEL